MTQEETLSSPLPTDPLTKPPTSKSETSFSALFSASEALDRTKWTRAFTIHVNVALVVSVICFTVWFFIAIFGASFPWFVYPALAFAWTLSCHFYMIVRSKEWLQFHVCSFIIVNLICSLTWLATDTTSAWFLDVFFGLAVLLVPHWVAKSYHMEPRKNFYVHLSAVIALDTLLFFIWLDSGKGFPWFFYPIFGLAIPLIIQWTCNNYSAKDELSKKSRMWKMHSLLFADVQLMLFVTWVATGGFPWFVFALGSWGGLLAIHYFRYRRFITQSELPTQTATNSNAFVPFAGVPTSTPMYVPVQGQAQPGQVYYYVPTQPFQVPQTTQPILYPQVENNNTQQ